MSTEHVEPQIDQVTLPGEILKSAREAKGLTVEEMSAISNLTKQVIRGIEANEYSDLAGLSFVRGYLKLYAKKLGVDETTVLEPFDAWKRAEQGEDGGDHKPRGFDSKTQASDETGTPSVRWYALGGVVLVSLLVAGVVISMQDSTEIEPEIAPRVDAPVDPIRPALVESSDLNVEPEIDQGDEVQLSDAARTADDEVLPDESDIEVTDPDISDESGEAVAEAPVAEDSPAPPVEVTETSPEATDEQQAAEVADRVDNTEPEVAEVEESPAPSDRSVEESTAAVTQPEPAETPAQAASVADVTPTASQSENASEESAQGSDEPPARAPVSEGRVIAEAANLEAPSPEPVPPREDDRSDEVGLRVLSETVTGPNADDQAMGARGLLEMRFTGESWVEVRDVRGRLVVADLMEAGRFVSLQTFGPVEVLVGAVNDSTVIFNGETLDLSGRSYQNVARVTLGAETN